jgi:hypothetical protein
VTAAPVLDGAKARLMIAERTLAVLVAHAADPVGAAAEGPDSADQLALLRTAGVIDGPRAHPAIAGALAAIVRPELSTLELSYSGKAMRGWVSYDAAALLMPANDDDELRTLVQVHPTLLPEALARLVDLGPRPRPTAAAPVPVDDDAVGAIHRRWRLAAAWTLDDGTAGGAGLEILDAESGLWLLHPSDGDGALAWPVTPTFVWRHIVRMLMRRG